MKKNDYELNISNFWNDGNYQAIVELGEADFSKAKKSEKLFEFAYSYAECGYGKKSKQLYQILYQKEPNNTAVINNLAVRYEKEGDYDEAKRLFEQGLLLDSDHDYLNRGIKRVLEQLKIFENGLKKVKKEKIWFIDRVSKLYFQADYNGEIELTYSDRPTVLACSPEKATEVIDKAIKNGYLFKQENSKQYQASRYKINYLIKNYIIEQEERIKRNATLFSRTENYNVEKLEEIGYTDDLINKISKIQNGDYREIALRDTFDCASSLLLGLYKPTIILVGSLIEGILIDLLNSKKINKYIVESGKNKKVEHMDLVDLLYITNKEKLVKNTTYNLSQVVRQFRNIIHPTNEIKNDFEISESNANLMWSALKAIISDVLK